MLLAYNIEGSIVNQMRDLWKDLTLASRMLLKTPAVTVAVIVTLAVGIAANSVAFVAKKSVHAWLWEPHEVVSSGSF